MNNNKAGRFFLKAAESPTYYHVRRALQARGWKPTCFAWRADFASANFAFDDAAAQCLEYKHLLADLVSEYCPQVMPRTYAINDENWRIVLQQVQEAVAFDSLGQEAPVWILKPALLNNGQNIKIFTSLGELSRHYASSTRLGGAHVLQQYLTHPHLLRDQRKYSIRQFVILRDDAGAFLYRHGYYNVSRTPFAAGDYADLKSHLTNEHLYGDEPNVIQIPSERFATHTDLYPQIRDLLTDVCTALQQRFPAAFVAAAVPRCAIFGMDFMVDASGRLWLLEANHGPCFPVEETHPLQQCLYQGFWDAFIRGFVLPMAGKSTVPEDFGTSFATLISRG